MWLVTSLLCGLLFGAGLVISGMSDPAKVLNFLDLAGTWDPSLIFVMGGAVITSFVGFRVLATRPRPLLGSAFHWPTHREIDMPLVAGAALFGLGWGLSGFCPGPAITAIPLLATGTIVFIPTMLVGMGLARHWQRAGASD
jgi:uncharacterized protein